MTYASERAECASKIFCYNKAGLWPRYPSLGLYLCLYFHLSFFVLQIIRQLIFPQVLAENNVRIKRHQKNTPALPETSFLVIAQAFICFPLPNFFPFLFSCERWVRWRDETFLELLIKAKFWPLIRSFFFIWGTQAMQLKELLYWGEIRIYLLSRCLCCFKRWSQLNCC